MSVFTSRVTKALPVPHDPGQTVTIRKLAPKHLVAAAKAHQRESLDEFRAIGSAAFIKEIRDLDLGKVERPAVSDPVAQYDRATLLQKGVIAWTYDEPLEAASFEDLDEQTAAWLAQEILQLARPDLFQAQEEREAAQKNA